MHVTNILIPNKIIEIRLGYMEIRNGYGIAGHRVTGPVRVGDPLTLMINMRSKYDGFDIVVNDCYAHNGANKRIQLIDEYG